ncbi:MAG: WD40 repeat domain-containing protein, partial [Anaerolineae bacterium]
LWSIATFQPEHVLEGHADLIRDIKWDPSGSRLASTDFRGATVYIWDSATGDLLIALEGHTTGINNVAWMPEDSNIAANYFDGTVLVWDAGLRSVISRTPLDAAFISWSNDWSRVAGLSRSSEHPTVWNWAELYEDNQTMISTTGLDAGQYLVMEYRPYLYDVSSVTWNPNGQQIAVSSLDGRVYILDAATGSEIFVLEGTENSFAEAWQVAWSPDGSRLAGLIHGLGIQIWNTNDGTADGMLSPVDEWIWRIAWSPDGKYLVGGTVQGDIILWDASTHVLIFETSGHADGVNALAWHPNSNILASGSYDGTIILWDVNTGKAIETLTGHNGPVTALAWDSDGTQLASGGEDGTIRIWANE